MDLINQNLSKLLECISEVEGISHALEKKKAEIKFPKFDPNEASFDVDPPNIIPKRAYKKRKGN